jgi:hypothetical protein
MDEKALFPTEWGHDKGPLRLEITNLDDARIEVLKAVAELRASNPRLAAESTGWTLTD